jgi:Zn-dependent membrane protease YugP
MDFVRRILLLNTFPALLIGCVICSNNYFFKITLPVEYDASNRALGWKISECLRNKRASRAKGALKMGG